ncbi:DNA repair protein RecO [Gordonia sp. PP30]|uniref:DNA repair protein RecO n=1 Tax=unclassified Gordonia (in: high G+C Gram-positive bacteria) TaxID=2657482 RepID=UPI0020005617|nr:MULTISPECIES: DNA repair protein RecO [unclassified Gordonia (in: high G+C Gram-positive bacteria)]UQE73782.1 DNA repair protein RecO [Gordonia sp. PP30]
MRNYQDEAVVIRQHKLGEADRIITFLTAEHGLIRAVAKGIRRTRSRFGARLEPFAHVHVNLYPGRSLDIVTQVHTLDAFSEAMSRDYSRYTTACAVLETAERLAGEERAPAQQLYRLTVGALTALAEDRRERQQILDAFLLRAMGSAGWMPALDVCARCANPGPHKAFHVAAGGAVCVYCRPAGAATPTLGVLELMDALARGHWADVAAATPSQQRQATGLIAAHLQWHLERRLRTLPLVERDAPPNLAVQARPESPAQAAPTATTA